MSVDLEKYSKSIILAERSKNVDLIVCRVLGTNRVTSVYHPLMTCYICNGLTKKVLSVFKDMKRDANRMPTIETYNILLSTLGHSMEMVD